MTDLKKSASFRHMARYVNYMGTIVFGVPGFIALPVVGLLSQEMGEKKNNSVLLATSGVMFLLKHAQQCIDNVEALRLIDIVQYSDKQMQDYVSSSDAWARWDDINPKIALAWAMRVAMLNSEAGAELMHQVNHNYYEGVGRTVYSGVMMVMEEDKKEVQAIFNQYAPKKTHKMR